ncbi:hypothetical protein BCR42DRAFT_472695, partial [Absidia repens]
GEIEDDTLIHAFVSQEHWSNFQSRQHRSLLMSKMPLPKYSPFFPSTTWQRFWHQPMDLDARSLWYRLLHGKLYCQKLWSRFQPSSSSTCLFCSHANEDLHHLFLSCPIKWNVWSDVFQAILPQTPLTLPLLQSYIRHLRMPTDPNLHTTIWLLCSSTLQAIWRFHWQKVIHDVPFHTPRIIALISHLFARLRPLPPQLHYPAP